MHLKFSLMCPTFSWQFAQSENWSNYLGMYFVSLKSLSDSWLPYGDSEFLLPTYLPTLTASFQLRHRHPDVVSQRTNGPLDQNSFQVFAYICSSTIKEPIIMMSRDKLSQFAQSMVSWLQLTKLSKHPNLIKLDGEKFLATILLYIILWVFG